MGAGKVASLGDLFGSPQEMSRLRAMGLEVISSPKEAEEGQMIALPTWGASPETLAALQEMGNRILDATCPRDSLAHNLAYRLAREGYGVVVVGKAGSPAAESLMGRVRQGRREQLASLAENPPRLFAGAVIDATAGRSPDFRPIPEDVTHVAVVAQANVSMEAYRRVVSAAAARFEEVRAYNTICRSLAVRFQEAARLARECDALVVVEGVGVEADELAYIGQKAGSRVHLVSEVADLDAKALERMGKVGVVATTATPDWVLVSVVEELRRCSDAELVEGPASAV
jgi:4-hydroxy-3-methylbut-2-enyl diphosphate reductase